MKLNKFLTRTIVVTLLLTFLTFSVGRVNRVSAVGTVATVAGTALLATGVIYMSYLALTGAEVRVPVADDIELWLKDIGTKVVQYPSGSAAYQEMYEYYSIQDPIANVIDGVWSWTEDKLKSFANDFSDTRIIENIISYYANLGFYSPTTDFDYNFDIITPIYEIYGTGISLPSDYMPLTGARFILDNGTYHTIVGTNITEPYRNVKNSNNTYGIQVFRDGSWQTITSFGFGGYSNSTTSYYFEVSFPPDYYFINNHGSIRTMSSQASSYPPLANAEIYDDTTGEITEVLDSTQYIKPSWNDPDNDNRPVIPWVPIPDLPATIDFPSGYTGIDQWGFNLEDLLDNLSDLGESVFDLAVLKELINSFAGLHGDQYFLYYDNGDTNYYTYYQPTIYEGDYITYNYDISDQEEVMPVNLNDILLYTDNRYLDAVKENVANFGQAIGEYFAFWHNVDYELTYILFGCAIVTLVAMFIGKWGK